MEVMGARVTCGRGERVSSGSGVGLMVVQKSV